MGFVLSPSCRRYVGKKGFSYPFALCHSINIFFWEFCFFYFFCYWGRPLPVSLSYSLWSPFSKKTTGLFLTPDSVESQTAVNMFFKLTFFFIPKSILPLLCLAVVFQTVDLVSLGSSRGAFLANFAEIGKCIQGASKVRFPLDGIRCRACRIVFSRVNSPLTKYFNIVSIPVFVRSVRPGYFEQSSVSINPLHP